MRMKPVRELTRSSQQPAHAQTSLSSHETLSENHTSANETSRDDSSSSLSGYHASLTHHSVPLSDVWYSPDSIVERSLLEPVRHFLSRPRKGVRAKLVQAGYQLSGARKENLFEDKNAIAACERLSEALEAIHAGSLIVDDIQDGSRERRGEPPLHEKHGIPLALNAGNWLYFQPFEWIRELRLGDATELRLYRICHETMLEAHVGQALDLGTRIDEVPREKAYEICLKSLSMKTGALMALALGCGAAVAQASEKRALALKNFGVRFGVALQMFDDLGNFQLPKNHPKRMEDLLLRRPTWLWAAASRSLNEEDYRTFVDCVHRLPDDKMLVRFVSRHGLLEIAMHDAEAELESCMTSLETELGGSSRYPEALSLLQTLAERIRTSYGPSARV